MTDRERAKRQARRRPANPEIKAPPHAIKLGELPATAICGNDISSSCLYVSALAIAYSGKYAWLALLIGDRFPFRVADLGGVRLII